MTFQDPYSPQAAHQPVEPPHPTMPAARFRKLGANDDDMTRLWEWWGTLTPDEQEEGWVAFGQMDDVTVTAWLLEALTT